MSESNADIYARKFRFRPFEGNRRGRIYRICAVAWDWWIQQWRRSRATKILTIVLLFFANSLVIIFLISIPLQTSDIT